MNELSWCPDCGKMLPWKHDRQPTRRARFGGLVAKVGRFLAAPGVRIIRWADDFLESARPPRHVP